MLVTQLLEGIKISVVFQVIVRVDDVGAIFMASNITTMSYTKYIDITYKYVNEYSENRIVKIIFVIC